jgi:hypothetical protein
MGTEERIRRQLREHGLKLAGAGDAPQTVVLYDQIGRELNPGDQVVVVIPSVMATVQSVTPILHPGMPQGTVSITLMSLMKFLAPVGGQAEGVYRLHTAREIAAVRGRADQREGKEAGQPGAEGLAEGLAEGAGGEAVEGGLVIP